MANRQTSARLYSLMTLGGCGLFAVSLMMVMPALREVEIFVLPALFLVGWLSMPALIRFFDGRTQSGSRRP